MLKMLAGILLDVSVTRLQSPVGKIYGRWRAWKVIFSYLSSLEWIG